MPLYEFYCGECERKIEELCPGDQKSISCPKCGSRAGKVFSTFRTVGGSKKGGGSSCGSG